jgi:hypothetical protein
MPLHSADNDPRYDTYVGCPIDVQIFRMFDGDHGEHIGHVTIERYYKNPNNDAVREWIRASDPKPRAGRYLFVSPESHSGESKIPCATIYTISYPEFMITRPKSNEPGFQDQEVFFKDDPFFPSVRARSR